MRLIIILIALCLIRKSLQIVEFYDDETLLMNRLLCVNIALEKYLKDNRNIWIFSSNLNSPVNSLLKVPLIVITKLDLLREALYIDRGLMIIFLEGNVDQDFDSLQSFQDVVRVEPIILVCVADMVCSSKIYMSKIIEMIVGIEMRYIAVNERGIIDIYEYVLIAEGICGVAQFFRRGDCSDKLTAETSFRRHVNFHECPMRVATWPYPPYSKFCDSETSNLLCGIEGTILEIIAKKVNATPLLLITQSPDGTLQDVRRLVANRTANLGLGGLDTRLFEGVSYFNPYMIVQSTFIASHSTWVLDQSLMNILHPLELEVWIGIGVIIVMVFILRILVPYFRKIYLLQLFGVFLGIPLPRQSHGLSNRIYIMSLVLFGYLCSQSYLTNLTKMLASPQQQIIKTLDDLEHSMLRVIGPADSRERFKTDYPRIYSDFEVQNFSDYYDNLFELLHEGRSNSVYYIEEMDSRIPEWKTIEAINDRFNWYTVALVAPNTSLILKASNNIFMRIDESGILKKYGILIPINKTYQSAKNYELESFERSVVLEFDELQSVFILLTSGLNLSLLVFLIEIITSFIKRKVELRKRDVVRPKLSRRRRFLSTDIE